MDILNSKMKSSSIGLEALITFSYSPRTMIKLSSQVRSRHLFLRASIVTPLQLHSRSAFVIAGMANTRSMTRKLKNGSSAPWSNLDYDLLFLIMMHLGVVDFFAFSGVCKSWRSFAISNWNRFMVSKQPMNLSISARWNNKMLYLEDYNKRKLATPIPHSNSRICIGVTCGYLIFFGNPTHDFWLVNPFTRKELHFPDFLYDLRQFPNYTRGILVFSPSMSGWVFVVSEKFSNIISFSLPGKQAKWRHIFTRSDIHDLHFFKGKIYVVSTSNDLGEVRLSPEPTFIIHKMKDFSWPEHRSLSFVSSDEHLYVKDLYRDALTEVDFDEMKWVNSERTIGEYAVFIANLFKCDAAIKQDTWIHPWTQYKRINCAPIDERVRGATTNMWYFPHQCLIDNDSDLENGALLNKLEDYSKEVGESSSSCSNVHQMQRR